MKSSVKRLETERLILEGWTKKDARDLFAYARTPKVGPLAGWKPHVNLADSKQRIKKVFIPNGIWKITMKDEGKAIGSIGFEPDPYRPEVEAKQLGYSLSEDYWGLGIMTEAGTEVLRYAFEEMQLPIVSIETAPDNDRSRRVIDKLGFKYEGTMRDAYLTIDGKVRDTLIYSIKREEWEDAQSL